MENIKQLITDLTNLGLDGEKNELEVWLDLKTLEDHIKACKINMNKYALDEADKLGEKDIINGYTVKKISKRTWEYDHIDDYNVIKKSIKDFEAKSKAAYNTGMTLNPDTGEFIEPAHCTSSEYLKATKKK